MTPFTNYNAHQALIDGYDGINHQYWDDNSTALKHLKKDIRSHLTKQQDYFCPYCNYPILSNNGNNWDIDHVIPKSLNPRFLFEPNNLVLSCKDCNTIKNNKNTYYNSRVKVLKKYPNKAQSFLIIHPFLDPEDYSHHIYKVPIGDSHFHIFYGKTPKGSKTIELCNLHRFISLYTNWENTSINSSKLIDTSNEELQLKLDAMKKKLEDEQKKIKKLMVLTVDQQKTIKTIIEI